VVSVSLYLIPVSISRKKNTLVLVRRPKLSNVVSDVILSDSFYFQRGEEIARTLLICMKLNDEFIIRR
jgi:hypothetical protein